jgi:signal transduction histidine kinase/tetratricopeptide (TPR) repeat protein
VATNGARSLAGPLVAVLEVLRFLHSRGVSHNDIKPGNVLISHSSVGEAVRVLDLGLAGDPLCAGQIGGTPAYWAPEVAEAKGRNALSDLYSLGVSLYEVLAGVNPFDADSLSEIVRKHKEVQVDALDSMGLDAPTWVSRLVRQCLEKDPERRPQSALAALRLVPDGERLSFAQTSLASWFDLPPAASEVVPSEGAWAIEAFTGADKLGCRRRLDTRFKRISRASTIVSDLLDVRLDRPPHETWQLLVEPEFGPECDPTREGGGRGAECSALVALRAESGQDSPTSRLLRLITSMVADGKANVRALVMTQDEGLDTKLPVKFDRCDAVSRGEISEGVREGLRVAAWTDEDTEAVHVAAQGELGEVLGILRSELGRSIVPADRGWTVRDGIRLRQALAGGIGRRVEAQLARLSGTALRLIRCIALWRSPVGRSEVARLGGDAAGVGQLMDAGLCVEGSGRLSVASSAVAARVLRDVGVEERLGIHRQLFRCYQGHPDAAVAVVGLAHGFVGEESVEEADLLARIESVASAGRIEDALRAARTASSGKSAGERMAACTARLLGQVGRSREGVELLCREGKPSSEEGKLALAKCLVHVGRFEDAVSGLAGLSGVEAQVLRAECLIGIGENGPEILENLSAALSHGPSTEEVLARLEKALGRVRAMNGNWDKADEHLERGLSHARSAGARLREAEILNNRGVVAENLEESLDGVQYYEAAARVYKELGAIADCADVYYNLGRMMKEAGELGRAREQFLTSVSLAERFALGDAECRGRLAVANTHLECGEYREALSEYRRALSLTRIEDDEVRGRCLYGVGICWAEEGQCRKAHRMLTRAVRTGVKAGKCLLALGALEDAWCDRGAARTYARACRLSSEAEDRAFARCMVHVVRQEEGRGLARAKLLKRAMAEAKSVEATDLAACIEALQANAKGREVGGQAQERIRRLGSRGETRQPYLVGLARFLYARLDPTRVPQDARQWGGFWGRAMYVRGMGAASRKAGAVGLGGLSRDLAATALEFQENLWQPGFEVDGRRRVQRLGREVLALGGSPLAVRAGDGGAHRLEYGLRKILETSTALNSTRDQDELLRLIARSVLELCVAERVFVILSDGEDYEIVASQDRFGNAVSSASEEVSWTIVRRTMAEGHASLYQDALGESDLVDRPSIQSLELRSILCVPLVDRRSGRGVVYLDNRSNVGQFDSVDRELVRIFASQASTAISNNKLIKELRESYGALSRAQDAMLRTERIRVLGEMASGVAHDFNNLLTAILARSQLLQAQSLDEYVGAELRVIERAASDAAQIVRRIQDFTRVRKDRERTVVDMRAVVRDAVAFTESRWQKGGGSGADFCVRVFCAEARELPVEGCAAELREAVTNVVINGIEAMEHGGRLVVLVRERMGRVEVAVGDGGTGFQAEVVDSVFDPFFTTKGERGSGLGLSLVYGIVTRHGGEVRVGNRPGGGAYVVLGLPRAEARGSLGVDIVGDGTVAGLRVLVVDDEAEVRSIAVRILLSEGADVVEASGGEEALELLGGQEFDVVLTDWGMPVVDGFGVAEAASAREGCEVILMTGWGVRLEEERLGSCGVSSLLLKPFTVQDLLGVVGRSVGR